MNGRNGTAISDQARELRRIVELHRQESRSCGNLRTIAVLGGKGGVGKSNLSVGLACALAEQGNRVVLLDADLGLANIDILCGVTSRYNLINLIEGNRTLEDILVEVTRNVWLLPGGSGVRELADLDDARLAYLIDSLGSLEDRADILLIDTGAGIHRDVLAFALAADTAILLTTPEPTSIRDSYGVLKALVAAPANGNGTEIVFVVNMVGSEAEGEEVAGRIRMAASQFLGMTVNYMGCVLKDDLVGKAVRIRKPFFQLYPASVAAECVRRLADGLLGSPGRRVSHVASPRGLKTFFLRLTRGWFRER